ncbi:hypothetical protein L6164_002935 [Bauhinia variegata]|uniref:Uncharacterized protein n=1 Tax=Bauhinia variegata TaxID=167791 RepID=A0ACB9Q599_BAUVA|nr:hypothetical protein L6164_002935 [Bauhinia variegata]
MEETFCGKLSGLYRGPCFTDAHCNELCRNNEGADNGICSGYKCWCRMKCGNICNKLSGIWKGPCLISSHCDKQCRDMENAIFGSCGGLFECLCAYDC